MIPIERYIALSAALFVIGTLTMAGGAVLDYVFIAERAAGNMMLRNTIVAGACSVVTSTIRWIASIESERRAA